MNIETGSFYIKIPNEITSANIQKKLFKMGFRWSSGDKTVKFTNRKILCLDDRIITYTDDDGIYIIKNKSHEISERDILGRGYAYEY